MAKRRSTTKYTRREWEEKKSKERAYKTGSQWRATEKKSKKRRKQFAGTVKESVGTESKGYEWPDFMNTKWGMDWY